MYILVRVGCIVMTSQYSEEMENSSIVAATVTVRIPFIFVWINGLYLEILTLQKELKQKTLTISDVFSVSYVPVRFSLK